MASEKNLPATPVDESAARREFIRTLGKAAITAPAVALLLSATTTPASANRTPYGPDDTDFTL